VTEVPTPIPMRLVCPTCGALHVDEGEFATKPHHTHSCQTCGMTWRPAVVPTVGVRFLPGFKNDLGDQKVVASDELQALRKDFRRFAEHMGMGCLTIDGSAIATGVVKVADPTRAGHPILSKFGCAIKGCPSLDASRRILDPIEGANYYICEQHYAELEALHETEWRR